MIIACKTIMWSLMIGARRRPATMSKMEGHTRVHLCIFYGLYNNKDNLALWTSHHNHNPMGNKSTSSMFLFSNMDK